MIIINSAQLDRTLGFLKSPNAWLPLPDNDWICMRCDFASEIFFFFKLPGGSNVQQNLGITVVKTHILGPGQVLCSIDDIP